MTNNHIQAMPVIYILSCGHSGSTLLDMLLNAHPQVMGLGEIEKIGDRATIDTARCSCGERVSDCGFWQAFLASHPRLVAAKLRAIRMKRSDLLLRKQRYHFVELGDAVMDPDFYLRATEELYLYAQKNSGREVLIDSSKNIFRLLFLYQKSVRIKPVVLFLTRDGRGVTWSYKKVHPQLSLLHHMRHWATSNLKAELILWWYKIPHIHITYEELARNPEAVLSRITQAAGIDFSPSMLDFDKPVRHQVGGNKRVLFASTSVIREDLSWRSHMPKRVVRLFNLLLGWLNMRYRKNLA